MTDFITDGACIDEIEKHKQNLLNSCEWKDYVIDGKTYEKFDAIFILDEILHDFKIQE